MKFLKAALFLAVLAAAPNAVHAVDPVTYEQNGIWMPFDARINDRDAGSSTGISANSTQTVRGRVYSIAVKATGNDVLFTIYYQTGTIDGTGKRSSEDPYRLIVTSQQRVSAGDSVSWNPKNQVWNPRIVFSDFAAGTTAQLKMEYDFNKFNVTTNTVVAPF